MTDIAWTGDEPLVISNSEIQTFKDCRRKWWLAYYRELGLKRDESSFTGARELGTKIHIALDELYTNEANPLTVLEGLYTEEIDSLAEHPFGDDIEVELRKEWDLAKAMLEGFMVWREEEGIDAGMELIGAEQVVQVKSPVPGVNLRGKLDQRWLRKVDGARLFRDWKTVQSVSEPAKILPLDEQMKFYHLLEYLESMEKTGKEPEWRTDGALYTMLRKVKRTAAAKPPFYGQVEVHHNKAELLSMWKRTTKVIEEIVVARQQLDAGGDHLYLMPPRPSRDCTWKCDFFAVCPLFDDGSNAEGLLDERYEHQDPHRRYLDAEETKGQ